MLIPLVSQGTPIGTYMCKLTCPTNVFTAELPLLFDQDLSEAQSLVATCGLLDENGQRWDTGPRIEFPVTVAGVQ